MHRASASENTSAPLSHHLQDSTHISFGVVTTGFTYRWFKLEGSVFNGREPARIATTSKRIRGTRVRQACGLRQQQLVHAGESRLSEEIRKRSSRRRASHDCVDQLQQASSSAATGLRV
jgi:hypothetical protein